MKALVIINKIALFTTIPLFIIIYFGLLAQIALGVIQVISALYLTIRTYNKSNYARRHLSNYWIATITELILVYYQFYLQQTNNDLIIWPIILIFPMSIAVYFYLIMSKIVKEHENTTKPNVTL
jgi:hypothetical protein